MAPPFSFLKTIGVRFRWKLRGKFLAYMIALIICLMGGVFVVVDTNDRRVTLNEGKKRGLSNVLYLAALSTSSLLMYDYAKLEQNVDEVAKEPDVVYAIILDKNGRVMAHSERNDLIGQELIDPVSLRAMESLKHVIQEIKNYSPGEDIWDIAYPIFQNDVKWGIVRIGFSTQSLHLEILKNQKGLIVLSLIAMLLSGAGATVLAERISRPIRKLSDLALLISKGNLSQQITVKTGDEMEDLSRSFNRMSKELANNRDRQRKLIQELSKKNVILKREIATRERLEEEIIKVERLRALGEMSGGVAHDFNNILGAILGRAQLLLEKAAGPGIAKGIRVIEKAALDGAEIVRRIQEFTRVRVDNRLFEQVSLNELIGDVIEFTRTRWKTEAQALGIHVSIRKEFGEIPPMTGDPAGMREVFTNIIINAVDAMPAGGVIRIRSFRDGNLAIVMISDTGVGMSPEVQKRIFEPFFTTKGSRGNGLGLAMCYGIISRHQGKILVTSKQDIGTTFTIQLPLNHLEGGESYSLPAPEPADVPARILIIDDDKMMRAVLSEILMHLGCRVDAAENGRTGLEYFSPERYDLVISDLGMDEMNGWEVARNIKERSEFTPVALVTGWGAQLEGETIRSRGIDFVVAKPFRIEEIRNLLGQAVTLKKSWEKVTQG